VQPQSHGMGAGPAISMQPGALITREAYATPTGGHTDQGLSLEAKARPVPADRSGSQETFAAAEDDSPPSAPMWTHAGTNKAEAGFQDPLLGWVSVRARADANGVHATVVPSSLEAGRELGSALPELQAFLAAHHPGQTVTLDAPAGPSPGHSGTSPDGGASGQGSPTGRDARGENRPSPDEERRPSQIDSASREALQFPESVGIRALNGGTHISVIA
jgi:hypothetical protein